MIFNQLSIYNPNLIKKIMDSVKILRNIFFSHSPFRLVHDLSYECNCKCRICERWKKSSNLNDQLNTKEIFKMLEDAKKTGIIYYVVEGGEPLLSKDLPLILKYAKKLNLKTTVITNGFCLKERYQEIHPFIDSLVVSLDSNDVLHDEMRRLKGIRDRAIEGIKLFRNSKTKIVINSVLCKLNVEKIDGLIKLSKDLEIPIIFQPMDIYKGYNEDIRLTQPEIKKTFLKIFKMKKDGYNIGNSFYYLQYIIENKPYVCNAPKCYTYVEPNGNIVSCCDIFNKIWGNVKQKQFKEIFGSREFKDFCKKMENCNYCSVYAVIESSLLYSLNPRYFFGNIFH